MAARDGKASIDPQGHQGFARELSFAPVLAAAAMVGHEAEVAGWIAEQVAGQGASAQWVQQCLGMAKR